MKKNILILSFLLSFYLHSIAQQEINNTQNRIIEVTGTAEMSIPPNQAIMSIKLSERAEGKEKSGIDKQEADLKNGLLQLGIDIQKDLKIIDLNSLFNTQRRKKVWAANREYRLTVNNIYLLGKIQEMAESLKIDDLDLISVTNTDLPKYRKEAKIEAIKSAKEKAEYMLNAIGQKLGKVIYIQEASAFQGDGYPMGNVFISKAIDTEEKNELGLRNIILKFNVLAKFEIE